MALDAHVHHFSTDEYHRIVGTGALDGIRVELLDGLLVDMTPQGEEHVAPVQRLAGCFSGDPMLVHTHSPLAVAVAEGWVPEPDFAIAHRNRIPRRHPETALLVAEVAISSKQVDLRKAAVYAGAGIPIYWLVDVLAGAVLEHRDPGFDGYEVVRTLRGEDILDAQLDDMASITVAALLAD